MDESLSLECIDNTIEGREIHPYFSFFTDEAFFEFRESDTRVLPEYFDESFTLFCDTVFWHIFWGAGKN